MVRSERGWSGSSVPSQDPYCFTAIVCLLVWPARCVDGFSNIRVEVDVASLLKEPVIPIDGAVDHTFILRAISACCSHLHRGAYDEDAFWLQSQPHALEDPEDVIWLEIAHGPPIDDDVHLLSQEAPVEVLHRSAEAGLLWYLHFLDSNINIRLRLLVLKDDSFREGLSQEWPVTSISTLSSENPA